MKCSFIIYNILALYKSVNADILEDRFEIKCLWKQIVNCTHVNSSTSFLTWDKSAGDSLISTNKLNCRESYTPVWLRQTHHSAVILLCTQQPLFKRSLCGDNVREMSTEACQRCLSPHRAWHLPALSCSWHAWPHVANKQTCPYRWNSINGGRSHLNPSLGRHQITRQM